jgi:ElaB/YqjD/DUF883 family membrane-anchored ribosome-binding protein
MGKRSDELRREIADYRRRLDAKVNRLDERVRSDLQESRETVDRDMRERLQLDKYAEERPFLTMAAAFGAGILLGSLTPSIPMPSMSSRDGRGPSRNGGASESGTGGGGFLASIIGSASGALSGTIEDEVRQLFSQVTGGREKASDDRGSRRDIDRHEDDGDADSSEGEGMWRGSYRSGQD